MNPTTEKPAPARIDRREEAGAELACAITLIKNANLRDTWDWTVKVGGREQWGSTSGSRRDAWAECRTVAESLWAVR